MTYQKAIKYLESLGCEVVKNQKDDFLSKQTYTVNICKGVKSHEILKEGLVIVAESIVSGINKIMDYASYTCVDKEFYECCIRQGMIEIKC